MASALVLDLLDGVGSPKPNKGGFELLGLARFVRKTRTGWGRPRTSSWAREILYLISYILFGGAARCSGRG